MMKTLKRVLATILAIAMLPVATLAMAAGDTDLLVNESFNDYVTDSKPNNLKINAKVWGVVENGKYDKALKTSTSGIKTNIQFDFNPVKDIVISFDIKANSIMPTGDFLAMDSEGNYQSLLTFIKGSGAKVGNGVSISGFDKTKFTNYTIIYRAEDKACDVYVNGSLKVNNMKLKDAVLKDITAIGFLFDFNDDGEDIILDNVNAYEGRARTIKEFPEALYNATQNEPAQNNEENNIRKIDVSKEQGIFADDTKYAEMMKGYTGIHATSGVVYVNDTKVLLNHTPIKKGTNEFMLPVEELSEVLGVNVAVEGETYNGVVYADADAFINALGKTVTKVPSTYNDNMYILGDGFVLPEAQADIDALNDYLLYYRPDAEGFKALYDKSPLAGVHPRIQFTQADFDRMVELTKTDENMKIWKDQVIRAADVATVSELPAHVLYDGLRMDCQRKLSKDIHALAVAYYITKDQKYLDNAYLRLKTVSEFDDWNPFHHLDTCEMMAAVAVGYDWLYNFFTPEQRAVIEEGMYKNGFYESYLGMLSDQSLMRNAFSAGNNHGNVDNGGLLMAVLAFMDAYPEEASWLGANTLRGAEIVMYKWAPEGSWYEGAGYWELTMQFTAKWLNTLDSVFVNGLGMGNLEGLDLAAMSEIQSQSPNGVYNFADAMPQNVYVPEMFYLANKYDTKGVYQAVIDGKGDAWADAEDVALAMMWYHPEMITAGETMGLDYMMESIDTLVMRDSWDTDEPTFVGTHAGLTTFEHSQLDAGSFIYEHAGIRWIPEIGMGNYNSKGYWDTTSGGDRWMHLRSRAEGHSTIAVNPGKIEDHDLDSFADQTIVVQKPKGVITTVDMSEVLFDVTDATRGFAFTDDRQSLVVRDELTLEKRSDVYWFMLSKAEGTVEGNSIILNQDGKSVKVEWTASAPVTAEYAPIAPLPTSPEQTDGWTGDGYKRLTLKMETSGKVDITVKITPTELVKSSALSDWDKAISEWEIPDGELPVKPRIDSIEVAGQTITAGRALTLNYFINEADYPTPPQVYATSDEFDVEITQASNFDEYAQIVVTDKADPTNRTIYTVVPQMIRTPLEFEGKESLVVRDFEVSEVPQPENAPIHMFDNDPSTRWSAAGYGQWIKIDLGTEQKFNEIAMSFMSGHTRSTKLVFSVSNDGETWTELWSGLSCGTTEELEFFDLGDVTARYIKIGCNGNTSPSATSWNSVTEIIVTRNK